MLEVHSPEPVKLLPGATPGAVPRRTSCQHPRREQEAGPAPAPAPAPPRRRYPPAAKCSGVDLRPAMSLAFTLPVSTRRFTRVTSPLRQASSSSRKAPLAAPGPAASGLSAAGLDATDDDADEEEDEEELLVLLAVLCGGPGAATPAASEHSGAGGRSGSGGASPSGPARLWRCAAGARSAGARLGLRGGEAAAGGEAGPGSGGG